MHDMTIPAVPRRIGVVVLTALTTAAIALSATPAAHAGVQCGCDPNTGGYYQK